MYVVGSLVIKNCSVHSTEELDTGTSMLITANHKTVPLWSPHLNIPVKTACSVQREASSYTVNVVVFLNWEQVTLLSRLCLPVAADILESNDTTGSSSAGHSWEVIAIIL